MEGKIILGQIKVGKLRPKGFKLIPQDDSTTAATTKRNKLMTNYWNIRPQWLIGMSFECSSRL